MADKQAREPIAIWWRIKRYGPAIVPLRIVGFTAAFVTYMEKDNWSNVERERRERRDDIFSSFAEAKAEFVRRATLKVGAAKNELQRARTELGQIESLKDPAED